MFTEKEVRPIRFLYEATLSNGEDIFVLPKGRAVNSVGEEYCEISTVDRNGDLIQLGWENARLKK